MGDKPASMLAEAAQNKVDFWVGLPVTTIAYFKAIPWAEMAAALACVWWAMRIFRAAYQWWKRRK